jgi:hypothetical protein
MTLFRKKMTLKKNPKKMEKFPKYNKIIKKFLTENNFIKDQKEKKNISKRAG